MDKTTVCIGDIHGMTDEFQEMLRKLSFSPGKMRLVLLGDLVDRGPDSAGCVRLAREIGAECVLGNHDEKYVRWRRNERRRLLHGQKNNMSFSPEKRKVFSSLTDADIDWMQALPLKIDIGNGFWAIHGGLEPGKSLDQQAKDKIIRVRNVSAEGKSVPLDREGRFAPGTRFWTEGWDGKESIVYGHMVHSLTDPREDIRNGVVMLGIDTGCCFGGRLTAVVFHPDGKRELVQVQSKGRYAAYWGDEA